MGERTEWRDPDLKHWHEEHCFHYPTADDLPPISGRHRDWGDVYGTDIDWPYLEYDYGIHLALIDYKYRIGLKVTGSETNEHSYNNMALSVFSAPNGPVPYYIIPYTKSPSWAFHVIPGNDKARELAPKHQFLTELGYVTWLHWLRGRQVNQIDKHVTSRCDNQIFWESLHPSTNQTRKHKSKKKREKSLYTLFDQNPILQQNLMEEAERTAHPTGTPTGEKVTNFDLPT